MIAVVVIKVCKLGDTAFVEKDCVGNLNLQYSGEVEGKMAHEEPK